MGLTLSSKLDWSSSIISVTKTASKKIGALIRSMNFLFPEVALYLYEIYHTPMYGILLSCLDWCPYLLLGIVRQATKTNRQGCWSFTCCSSWILGSSSKCDQLFYRYYFGRCSAKLAQLVPLYFPRGRSTSYSDRLHDFSATIPRCYKDVYVNSFFPRTATLWNSLPIECFPLTYDLSSLKSRINRHLLTVGSF